MAVPRQYLELLYELDQHNAMPSGCCVTALLRSPCSQTRLLSVPSIPAVSVSNGRGARNVTLRDICFAPFGDACALQSVLQYWRMDEALYDSEQAKSPSEPRMTSDYCFGHWGTQCRSAFQVRSAGGCNICMHVPHRAMNAHSKELCKLPAPFFGLHCDCHTPEPLDKSCCPTSALL